MAISVPDSDPKVAPHRVIQAQILQAPAITHRRRGPGVTSAPQRPVQSTADRSLWSRGLARGLDAEWITQCTSCTPCFCVIRQLIRDRSPSVEVRHLPGTKQTVKNAQCTSTVPLPVSAFLMKESSNSIMPNICRTK